jgi:hypothetical protein
MRFALTLEAKRCTQLWLGACLFRGQDGGLWEWSDLPCHSLVVCSFKIEFFVSLFECTLVTDDCQEVDQYKLVHS